MNKHLERFLAHFVRLLIIFAMLAFLMAPSFGVIKLGEYLGLEDWQIALLSIGSFTVSVPTLMTLIDAIFDWKEKRR